MANPVDVVTPPDQEGTEAMVLRWFKRIGDAVTEHEPLLELETDKVTIEVPAPAAGVLSEIVAAAGETVGLGALLGNIAAGAAGAAAPAATDKKVAEPAAAAIRPHQRADAGGRHAGGEDRRDHQLVA